MSLMAKKVNFTIKATTQGQIYYAASRKRPFQPKLKRQNAIMDKTMRDLSQKGFLHPLNGQIDEDTGVVLYFSS